MKCIRIVGQGVPIRVPDADAFQIIVRDLDGEYCPKKFWREWYAAHGTEPARCMLAPDNRIVRYVETA